MKGGRLPPTRTEQIKVEYFNWLADKVDNGEMTGRKRYDRLLSFLFNRPFDPAIRRDVNRAEDGCELRYRFGNENGYYKVEIKHELDDVECSMLEMMVALSIRMEETIMHDDDKGNRTAFWFWEMVDSLGLFGLDDRNWNEDAAISSVRRFQTRKYSPNGRGGLFIIRNPKYDMRRMEIWYQMNEYLNEYLGEEGE